MDLVPTEQKGKRVGEEGRVGRAREKSGFAGKGENQKHEDAILSFLNLFIHIHGPHMCDDVVVLLGSSPPPEEKFLGKY